MNRRQLLIASVACALLPSADAHAKRPPQITLRVKGVLSRREQVVYTNGLELRFALFESAMARNPLWSETVELKVRDGVVDVELGKRALGDMETDALPETVFLQVQVLRISDEALDAKLSPRLELDWQGSGAGPCLGQTEAMSLDGGSGCVLAGPGNLLMVLEAFERDPKPGTWPPPEK